MQKQPQVSDMSVGRSEQYSLSVYLCAPFVCGLIRLAAARRATFPQGEGNGDVGAQPVQHHRTTRAIIKSNHIFPKTAANFCHILRRFLAPYGVHRRLSICYNKAKTPQEVNP